MRILRIPAALFLLTAFVVGCSDQPVPTGLSDSPAAASSDAPLLSAARGPVVHGASLGSSDLCSVFGAPPGCDANFSLIAREHADGNAYGQWQDSFGFGGQFLDGNGSGGVHIAVDCLHVDGNEAVIGGVVTKFDLDPAEVGGRALTAMVDNGTSANDPADQLSFSFFGAGTLDFFFDGEDDCQNLTIADFVGPISGNPLLFDVDGQVRVW